MTENEIVREYKTAKDKRHQIEILADLNATSTDEIKRILKDNGVDLRGANGRKAIPKVEAADPVPGELGYVQIIEGSEKELPDLPPKEEKPPIGLTPRELAERMFNESRVRDIIEAMHRYYKANMAIPEAWRFELRDRL